MSSLLFTKLLRSHIYPKTFLLYFALLCFLVSFFIFFSLGLTKLYNFFESFFPSSSIIRKLLLFIETIDLRCLVPKCHVLSWPYFLADAQHSSCYLSARQCNRIVKRFEKLSDRYCLDSNGETIQTEPFEIFSKQQTIPLQTYRARGAMGVYPPPLPNGPWMSRYWIRM